MQVPLFNGELPDLIGEAELVRLPKLVRVLWAKHCLEAYGNLVSPYFQHRAGYNVIVELLRKAAKDQPIDMNVVQQWDDYLYAVYGCFFDTTTESSNPDYNWGDEEGYSSHSIKALGHFVSYLQHPERIGCLTNAVSSLSVAFIGRQHWVQGVNLSSCIPFEYQYQLEAQYLQFSRQAYAEACAWPIDQPQSWQFQTQLDPTVIRLPAEMLASAKQEGGPPPQESKWLREQGLMLE